MILNAVLIEQSSLILSCHLCLSSKAFFRSSRLYPVSVQSCRMEVLDGQPTSARPHVGVNNRTSFMSLPFLH